MIGVSLADPDFFMSQFHCLHTYPENKKLKFYFFFVSAKTRNIVVYM